MANVIDRDLLRLAAKAAGMAGWKYGGEVFGMLEVIDPLRMHEFGSKGSCWNPLLNDGDALRLMVQLNLVLKECCNSEECYPQGYGRKKVIEFFVSDKGRVSQMIAARRAIVRAAAEIGKVMP